MTLLAHVVFVGELGGPPIGPLHEPATAALSVRTIAPPRRADPGEDAARLAEAAVPAPPPAAPPPQKAAPRPGRVDLPIPVIAAPTERAGNRSGKEARAAVQEAAFATAAIASPPPRPEAVVVAVADAAGPPASTAAAPQPLLAPGEQPPPVYRTHLPPSVTLRYQVRRGFLRGTGEIRWRHTGETYQLVLEARLAGLTLLVQSSEGGTDATGLAPLRFLDQRARRPAQAANFRRDLGTITFSGPGVEWPLMAGSQDRLSWMIQLAAIAAAEPGRLVDGGRISMVVVGARGEASVWTMRYAGHEDVDTPFGTVHAVKLVRDGGSTYDTHAEIWLDPAHDYLPAHATLRNSAGVSEYDLFLERIDPAS